MSTITGSMRLDAQNQLAKAPQGQVKVLLRAPAVECDHGTPLLAECFKCIWEYSLMRFLKECVK